MHVNVNIHGSIPHPAQQRSNSKRQVFQHKTTCQQIKGSIQIADTGRNSLKNQHTMVKDRELNSLKGIT